MRSPRKYNTHNKFLIERDSEGSIVRLIYIDDIIKELTEERDKYE